MCYTILAVTDLSVSICNFSRPLMALTGVLVLLTTAPLSTGADRPADFGQQWVRAHPFTIMALTLRNEAVAGNNWYSEAGLGTMLAWKYRPEIFRAAVRQKIPWHYHINKRNQKLNDTLKSQVNQLIQTYPGGQGFLVWDEPKLPDMPKAAPIVAWLKETYPDALVYSNINPVSPIHEYSMPNLAGAKYLGDGVYDETSAPYTYDDHLDNLVHIVKPDVLMGDVYPFWAPQKLDPDQYFMQKYFFMLAAFRKAGLKNNLPYWIFVQAYEHAGRCRYPSESDVRVQVYSSLAFGFSGIAYFTYDPPLPEGRSLLNQDLSRARLYEDVKKLNREVSNLGKALRFLTSTDVRYIRGHELRDGIRDNNPVPRAMAAFDPRSRVAKTIRVIRVDGSSRRHNGLIGLFRDDSGGEYFMLVNLRHAKDKPADALPVSFVLEFDASVESVYQLSRDTGQIDMIHLEGGKLAIPLPGGTGDLFKLRDGGFPGIKAKTGTAPN